ncbi:thiamine phosphate synthase [Stenotrophomonas sp. MMGLT7]|uniref:thiamine phosphate synthase n=1 Tax=Stenotrophomonas sp. MMGLT7 TaxID=2901227 RepID=UPI001E377F4A|nr:thiamine phosphate synthase [Stenotrophomonas sp. MMGLT7]MCD7098073.1 thiamine phosphate synthase [Stenotrophomonas sp. MMGLT7]
MTAGFDLALHLVTDEELPFPRLLEITAQALDGGVTVVQLRAKRTPARRLVAQACALSEVTRGRAALIVNDRTDVALAAIDAGARVDGVHLGQDDIAPATARRLLGPQALIGWTADTPSHLAEAIAMPPGTLDYLGVGVIRATGSKPDHPPVLGIDGFAAFAAASPLPCVAIGGIVAADVPALRAAGAAGVAVVSAICRAPDPQQAARDLSGTLATATGAQPR